MNTVSKVPATAHEVVASALTALFVPGDRPERFAKAFGSGADVVIIDLEDAVAPGAKSEALSAAVAELSSPSSPVRALVRINPQDSAHFETEVNALLSLTSTGHHGLLGIVVPKAEDSVDLRTLASRCDQAGLAVVALIETAAGVLDAPALALIRGISRLAFGAIDYALDIDADSDDRFLDYARSALVVASRAAGIAGPLDSPSVSIRDEEKTDLSARLGRGFGFAGKLCIHPGQISTVRSAFLPTDEEVQWAKSVVAASDGASQINGQMVDRPVVERAQRIITRSRKEVA
ncbi:HpcH/HpaI aldolase/citrate lyase family protein [Pseudarthrobacter sp. NPDC058119]|uniref:HpcH/HpaI aldolase/citrate lyase family protein n=1 Tax=Pseudarthrobacter sp. NPDC058119 TaxID=3346348 RepID=UPI0036D85228